VLTGTSLLRFQLLLRHRAGWAERSGGPGLEVDDPPLVLSVREPNRLARLLELLANVGTERVELPAKVPQLASEILLALDDQIQAGLEAVIEHPDLASELALYVLGGVAIHDEGT
jgi:hypothetical protein